MSGQCCSPLFFQFPTTEAVITCTWVLHVVRPCLRRPEVPSTTPGSGKSTPFFLHFVKQSKLSGKGRIDRPFSILWNNPNCPHHELKPACWTRVRGHNLWPTTPHVWPWSCWGILSKVWRLWEHTQTNKPVFDEAHQVSSGTAWECCPTPRCCCLNSQTALLETTLTRLCFCRNRCTVNRSW